MQVGGDSNDSLDFELNLAPIIDCFTVLITYLLVSAAFLSLSAFDVGVSSMGPSEDAVTKGPPPMAIIITLSANHSIKLQVTGGKSNINETATIDGSGQSWDIEGLESRVADYKKRFTELTDTSVVAEPTVQYLEVVQVIEALRKEFPKIYLSGDQ